jgi:phosphoserine phosphatase
MRMVVREIRRNVDGAGEGRQRSHHPIVVAGAVVGRRALDRAALLHSRSHERPGTTTTLPTTIQHRPLSKRDLEAILDVTTALAAPFDLATMLGAVVDAAKQVLQAERGSVWLYDEANGELVLEVATGIKPVRVPWESGLVGACARSRTIINVPDCYADPRFDSRVDKASGYRTRCMLTLPLVDHKNVLVGVMQVLNKNGGVFDADDEALATALAAQCAVALQRVRMTGALIEGEKMRQALEMAREVQMSTLPAGMPSVPGYDVAATFRPAELTGGDTFDVSLLDQGLLLVLGDATGHGIAPALSVTQMQAMLRMAFRLGADLETAFMQVNNRLAETLAEDRFITAFIGLLDPAAHMLRFHSGGQGPILRYRFATRDFERYKPTSFPLGAMHVSSLRPAIDVAMQPGDILVLVSDGIFEQENARGEQFGEGRVTTLVDDHRHEPAEALLARLVESVRAFADGVPQADDITAVLLKRAGDGAAAEAAFERRFDAIPALVEFTAGAFARMALDARLLPRVDLAVEELFTNMVKYGAGSDAAVQIRLQPIEGGVELTMIDRDVEPFDVTRSREVDIDKPIADREPGGLGLHLIRRMADSVDYDYSPRTRRSRIIVRFTTAALAQRSRARTRGENAVD